MNIPVNATQSSSVLIRQVPADPEPRSPANGNGTVEPIFSDPQNQGVDPTGDTPQVSVSENPDARPEEVAAYVKWNGAGTNPEMGRYAYLEALYEHRDDPQWLADFYQQLGPETTAELISQTTDPYTHSTIGAEGGDPEMAQAQAEAIRESLETLQDAGYLDQNALSAVLNEFPNNDTILHASTEIFGKADTELQELFVTTAAQADNDSWNAGALDVLNGLSSDRQQTLLTGLGDKLDAFIAGAMAGERSEVSFADAVQFGMHANMLADQGEIDRHTFGGVETLLATANHVTVYYHAQTVVPDFDAALQTDLFGAVSKGLNNPEVFDNFRGDAGFKEELSTLFMNNSQSILHQQAPDGAFANPNFIEGMTKFFEITLFTQDPGSNRETLMQHVVTTMGDVGDASAAPPLPQADYEAAHGGWSQQDHVEVMGGLQAMVLQAADNQKSYLENEILEDKQQREQMIGFVTGMAFAFVPGASDVLGDLAAGGTNWLSKVPGTIAEFGYEQGTSQLEEGAQQALLGLLSGAGSDQEALADITAFMETFKGTITGTSAALPNGEEGELSLRTAFQSAYAFYRDLVSF